MLSDPTITIKFAQFAMVNPVSVLNISVKLIPVIIIRYKEGRVILERALVTEMDGLDEIEPDDIRKE